MANNNDAKNIVMFLDGTWNSPEDTTRVWAAYDAAIDDGTTQISYYQRGLGTQNFEKFQGGVFGKGLGEKVREAYQWLVDNYNQGDKVFIFGFSRGAFTATSVTGMIMRLGLIERNSSFTVDEIFKVYEKWGKHPNRAKLREKPASKLSTSEKIILNLHRRRIDIEMIGIWDSVATVGVPFGNFARFSRHALQFHNPRISTIYKHVFHAMAIDEHRKPFRPILFNLYYIRDETGENHKEKLKKYGGRIEQRWFSGSHGDVGGGDNTDVSQAPYAWMLNHAQSLGLKYNAPIQSTDVEHTKTLNDPFKNFVFGLYKIFRLGKRYYRTIGAAPKKVDKNGMIEPLSETIDASVLKRRQTDPNYRPKNLEKWAAEADKDLDTLSGDIKITRGGSDL